MLFVLMRAGCYFLSCLGMFSHFFSRSRSLLSWVLADLRLPSNCTRLAPGWPLRCMNKWLSWLISRQDSKSDVECRFLLVSICLKKTSGGDAGILWMRLLRELSPLLRFMACIGHSIPTLSHAQSPIASSLALTAD
jgi:hypothetical protein